MSTIAVPDGCKLTAGRTYLTPLLSHRMGVTESEAVTRSLVIRRRDFMLPLVIHSPPVSDRGTDGLCDSWGEDTSGGTGLWGASTLGLWAEVGTQAKLRTKEQKAD